MENAKLDIKAKASNARSARRKNKREQFKKEKQDELLRMTEESEAPKRKLKRVLHLPVLIKL